MRSVFEYQPYEWIYLTGRLLYVCVDHTRHCSASRLQELSQQTIPSLA